MGHDPDTVSAPGARAAHDEFLLAGHLDDEASLSLLREGLSSDDERTRVLAIGGLARRGALGEAELLAAIDDGSAVVRRRAVAAAAASQWSDAIDAALSAALGDDDELVVVAALVAIADRLPEVALDAVLAVTSDPRPLVHEEAIATLGAFGDPRGLAAVLAAGHGKPALRRRSVAALGGFDAPAVEAALDELTNDRDWQVRQAVAMLRREPFDDESAIG
jgi:HEAT repeat protein